MVIDRICISKRSRRNRLNALFVGPITFSTFVIFSPTIYIYKREWSVESVLRHVFYTVSTVLTTDMHIFYNVAIINIYFILDSLSDRKYNM